MFIGLEIPETMRHYLQNSDAILNIITYFNELKYVVSQLQPEQKQTSINNFLIKD